MRLRATKLAAIGFGGARLPLPSLDLQFATDKTLTARRGPTPAFTRASGATQVNAAGLIEYAPENLVLQSEEFNNATWDKTTSPANWQGTGSAPAVTANDGISPRGDLTAERIVLTLNDGTSSNDRSGFSQVLSATVGVNYSVSVYVKPLDSTTDLQLINSNIGIATFGTILTRTVVDAGSGWKRIITTYVATSTFGTFRFQIVGGSGINQFTGLIWGAQLERHTSARDYIPTTAAAVYGPRFDHDPVTLACKGLLIEEPRTNLLPDSNSFNNWAQNSCATITSAVATPEGSSNAWKIREDLLFAVHYVTKGFTPVSGTTYTASVWLKSGENGFVFFGLTGGFPTTFVSVNLSTGAVSAAIGTPIQAISASYLNGWWRVSFSLVATASTNSNFDIRTSRDGVWANRTYTGNGVNGVYCFGAQVEAGSFPTSYIPTAAATVLRSADVCSITGSDFTGFYNQSEGTMLLKATSLMATATLGNRTFISFTDGSYPNQQGLYKATNTNNLSFPIGAGTGNAIAAITIGSSFTVSGAFAASNCAASFNGAAAVTVAGSPSTVVTKLEFRDPTGAPGGHPTMHISQFRYYKKRLPNAKLQSLTL